MKKRDSLPLELAYHSVTEPALLMVLEGLETDPEDAGHTVQTAAFHVMMSMQALEEVRPLVQSPEEAQNYNDTLASVHRAFGAVERAAGERNMEIRPGSAPAEEAQARHLLIEALRITVMLEQAEGAGEANRRQAFLVAIREAGQSLREMIDDWREEHGLGPMHEVPQELGPEGEARALEELRNSMPPVAGESVVRALMDAWTATPMRRRGMELQTGEDLDRRVHVDEPPLLTRIERFRDGNRSVGMAVMLPITPEYIANDQRDEFIVIIYEHLLHIVCQTEEDEYPSTVTNSVIRGHAEEMLAWASECEREPGGPEATHPAVVRSAAERTLAGLQGRRNPEGLE